MSTTKQNGSMDHAFGLSISSKQISNNTNNSINQINTHMGSFNFDDNFTEFNATSNDVSTNGSLNNDDSSSETITIVGDAKITQTSNLSNDTDNKKYILNNYDSISYNKTVSMSPSKQASAFTNSIRDDLRLSNSKLTTNNNQENHYENGFEYDDDEDENVRLHIQTMRKVFNVFDSDQDGSITIEDVEIVMNSLQYLKNEIEMPSVDQIRIAFDKFDSNKNGSIEFDEFLNILKSAASQNSLNNSNEDLRTLPIQQQHAKPIQAQTTRNSIKQNNQTYNNSYSNNNNSSKLNETSKATTNNHNNVNYNTFDTKPAILPRQNSTDLLKKNMKLIFEQFDKDNDGKITKNELNFVMCNLFPDEIITEQDINVMLHAADLDKNGFIDFEEFANMFMLYSQNASDVNESSEQIYNSSSSSSAASAKSPILNNKRNAKTLELTDNISGTSSNNSRITTHPRSTNSDIVKSSKPLTRTLSRSSSKEGKRSRTQSQTNSGAQSPANFRKVVQIFTSSQMMDLKAAFTMFDKNGDQKISESELLQVMKYLGVKASESDVRAMIQVVDKNRNGYVDYDEFIQMMTQTQLKPLSAEEELRKTFNIFDIDGNGFISADEIKKTMAHLGENLTDEEVNDMIKAADKNGDGRIDLHEFSGLLNGTSGGLKQSMK